MNRFNQRLRCFQSLFLLIKKLVRILHDHKGESTEERNWPAEFLKRLHFQAAKKTMR